MSRKSVVLRRRGASQKLKRLRPDVKADILEDFRSHSVAQADIFKRTKKTSLAAPGASCPECCCIQAKLKRNFERGS